MNRWIRTWQAMAVALTAALGLATAVPAIAAQGTPAPTESGFEELVGAPVDVHAGTCADPVSEPAYDAGDLGATTLDQLVESDDFWELGLFDADLADGFGIDFDDDDELEDIEFVGALGHDVPMGVAESDLGEDIDEAQPYVVALHAGSDNYGTILACGAIADTDLVAEDDPYYGTADIVFPLQPVNDSGIFGFSVIEAGDTVVHTYLFRQGTMPAPTTPTVNIAAGFPVGIHSGDCTNWTTEPAYDVGVMEQTNVTAPGEQATGDTPDDTGIFGDDGIFDESDEGYLRDDVDGDGVFEIGFDDNDDGILDDDEILGLDDDDDGILDDDELTVTEADAPLPTTLDPIYTVDTGTQFSGSELIDEGPYVVAVHKSAEEYDTLVACGPVLPIIEDDNVIVPLRPVGDSNHSGVFLINESNDEIVGFMWMNEAVDGSGGA